MFITIRQVYSSLDCSNSITIRWFDSIWFSNSTFRGVEFLDIWYFYYLERRLHKINFFPSVPVPSALCFLFALIVRDFPGITQDIYGTCTGRPQENFLIQTLNHLIWLNVKEQGFYSNFLLDACESIPVSKTEPRHHMEYFDYRYLQSHLLLPVGVGGYNTFTQYFFFTAHNARHPLGQHPVLYGEASPTTSTELAVAHISHPHTQKEMSKGVNPHITEFTVNYSKRITGELNHVGSQTLSPQEKHTPCQHQRLDVMLSPKITRSRQLFVVFAPPAPFVQLYI